MNSCMRNVFFQEILTAFECQKAIKNVQCNFNFLCDIEKTWFTLFVILGVNLSKMDEKKTLSTGINKSMTLNSF